MRERSHISICVKESTRTIPDGVRNIVEFVVNPNTGSTRVPDFAYRALDAVYVRVIVNFDRVDSVFQFACQKQNMAVRKLVRSNNYP